MPTIVISYRREDTGLMVGRICDRLREHYGRDQVMMDIDSIPFGLDFRKHIRETLKRCDVMLAIMGPAWAATDEAGQSRLADEADWVRIEIEAALAKDIPVIPVLVDEGRMPKSRELPETMRDLAFRQATEVDMRRAYAPILGQGYTDLARGGPQPKKPAPVVPHDEQTIQQAE